MKGWTAADIDAYQRRAKQEMVKAPKKARAVQRHVTGKMNGTEKRFFADHVEGKTYTFESLKFRLADNTWYTPDFMVIEDGRVVIYEVKGGFFRDDARAKFKVAAEMNPWFVWRWAVWKDKKWTIEEY